MGGINQGYNITAPLFCFDSSSLHGKLADLCNSIGCIADPEDPHYITQESLDKLNKIFMKKEGYVNIEELRNNIIKLITPL